MRLILFPVFILISLSNAEIYFKEVPHVKLGDGAEIIGKLETSREGKPYSSFLGIKYATVPERFAEAELISQPNWKGIKSGLEYGPKCMQGYILEGTEAGFQEDCLNLNVYVPLRNRTDGYPVMVFIHGGSFTYGSNQDTVDPFFVDEDVIVVLINYRLGVFGFASTGDEVIPGNNGLKDQILALKWIQENIAKFGGDKNSITIFGESSGGTAVNFLMLSDKAKGLFHRGISQSGSVMESESFFNNPRTEIVKLAVKMGCPTEAGEPAGISSEEILSCLRNATKEELNKAQYEFGNTWPENQLNWNFQATKEPKSLEGTSALTPFITESPYTILQEKLPIQDVPWIAGMNENECACLFSGYVLQKQELLNELNSKWEDIAPKAFDLAKLTTPEDRDVVSNKIREFYFKSKPISMETRDNLTNLYSDQLVGYGIYKSALEIASREDRKSPVFVYQYAWHGPKSLIGSFTPCVEEELEKVGHGDEMYHMFNVNMGGEGETAEIIKPGSKHETFSKNLVKLWASFAIHGEPKHSWGKSEGQKWNPVSKDETEKKSLKWYRIDENTRHLEQDPYEERVKFWDALHKEHFAAHI